MRYGCHRYHKKAQSTNIPFIEYVVYFIKNSVSNEDYFLI